MKDLPLVIVQEILGYVEELKTRDKKNVCILQISNAMSRKNGFNGQCRDDSVSEHWAFWAGSTESPFQAINCFVCGNYWTDYLRFPVTKRVACSCNHSVF